MTGSDEATLRTLLVRHHDRLVAFVRQEGQGLMRYESEEDLAQGVCARVLKESSEESWDDEKRFLAWLRQVARRHVADRHAWWSAMKRDAGRVVRMSLSADEGRVERPLDALVPGPSTLASKREMMILVMRALAALPPRDAELVRANSEGVSIAEQAERLGLSYDATQKAGRRALERFRKTFAIVSRG